MASVITEEDEENLRKQCENASLEDATGLAKKGGAKAQLPPIKLGMSFSDWKQMKEAEQESKPVKSAKNRKPTAQKRQNQNFNSQSFQSHQYSQHTNQLFRHQQQNFPNFNIFPSYQNPQNRRNFFQDQAIPSKIPPIRPSPIFDDFSNDDQQWSSGPLMQPMFPPMPRIPRLHQQGMRTNTSGQHNNRFLGQKRPSARIKLKSGQSDFKMDPKAINKEQAQLNTQTTNVAEVKPAEEIRTEPQVYVYRPRNTNRNEKVKTNWVVMPKAPPSIFANTPESREEKSRLWREYRQAMKPFKNREFKNAKRVIQRLGKKNYDELDEKERARLDRASEAVNAHKAMLTERMLNRSGRVEEQLRYDKTNISGGSTENSSRGWLENKSKDQPLWNGDNAQNSAKSNRQTPLMNSFVSGGVWQPPNVLTQPKS